MTAVDSLVISVLLNSSALFPNRYSAHPLVLINISLASPTLHFCLFLIFSLNKFFMYDLWSSSKNLDVLFLWVCAENTSTPTVVNLIVKKMCAHSVNKCICCYITPVSTANVVICIFSYLITHKLLMICI